MLQVEIHQAVEKILAGSIADRHHFHQHPELTWQEANTHQYILSKLREFPALKVRAPVGKYGIVATLKGGAGPGPVVALRADMDALPVTEKTGLPYASCHNGIMHACGHDGHMAILLGALRALYTMKDQIKGQIVFLFQPAEEGGAGADVMIKDGALTDPKVDVIYGLHGWPTLPLGKIGVRKGPLLASTCDFEVTVSGRGCHAAMPHLGNDSLLAACRMVDQLQGIVSRFVAPTEPLVVTIGRIQSGTATNVIAPSAQFAGTIRAVTKSTQTMAIESFQKICGGVASGHGVQCDIQWKPGYPPTVNHPEATDALVAIAKAVVGEEGVVHLEHPSMGGEDFAYYLEKIPGSFFFIGVDDGRATGYPGLHHPGYDFNDAAMATGIRLFCHLALEYGAYQT